MTKKIISHRCDGSLAAGASIRYEENFYDTPPKWYLKTYGINMDWDCVELESMTEIKYCPFCGEKLEAPTKKQIKQVERKITFTLDLNKPFPEIK